MAVNNGDPAVRLALLQERLSVLVDIVKASEHDTKLWREQYGASLTETTKAITRIHEAQHETQDKIDHLQEKLADVEVQLSTKIGWAGFRGVWRVVIGLTILITAAGGVISILRALRWIP